MVASGDVVVDLSSDHFRLKFGAPNGLGGNLRVQPNASPFAELKEAGTCNLNRSVHKERSIFGVLGMKKDQRREMHTTHSFICITVVVVFQQSRSFGASYAKARCFCSRSDAREMH